MTTETMRAATARRYGGPEVMAIEALAVPQPGPGQVLVRVEAFGVTRGDARIRGLDVPRGMGLGVRLAFGLRRPRRVVPGREFAGIVTGLGAGVQGWAPGEAVLGITDGMQLGAGAEYLCVSASGLLARRPAGMAATEAAGTLFGLMTAADFLRDQAGLQPGERVLVNGATGAVGVAALQVAALTGARVTALCSPANHDLARALGAETVADYRAGLPAGPFDLVLDIAGTLPWRRALPLLAPGGRLALVTADLAGQLGALLRPRRGGRRLVAGIVKENPAALARALDLWAQGCRPVITALPFAQIVEAHRLASGGHKRGAVVVTMGSADATEGRESLDQPE